MVLAPEPPIAAWLADLDAWLARSPGFFLGRPVALDVAVLQPGKQGLVELLQGLTERNIKVMGIEGAEPSWLDFAMPPMLLSGRQVSAKPGDSPPGAAEPTAPAPFSDSAPDAATPDSNAAAAIVSAAPAPVAAQPQQLPNSLLLDSSVRSGQSIVHPEGDVIIVGSVASGAEVVAGGSIHIYGPLRGRAIAGSRDTRARIFCRKLEAELLSIDGLYMVADDMPAHLRGKQVQVWLDGDSMIMAQD
ncbi:MAG: septum site-determining protein MinC [Beijerinckiaceae bacterium]|nr:septum site-determining protein MinC [Beijerinckiaceae bacterium]MCI0735582.1 septum site-determining protein MinC [Beijerinckiaceae bacterium]